MKKHILAAALAMLAAQAFSAEYYVVVPVRNHAAAHQVQVALSSAGLPDGQVGIAYPGFDFNSLLQVTGDTDFSPSGVQWSVASGSLPDGMTLGPSGSLSGTPALAGPVTFTASAAYKGVTAQATYSLQVQTVVGIAAQAGGYRTWVDGTVAASCDGYRNPGAGHVYGGATGDGTYRVQPSGLSAINVYCDMSTDGGGWTLAARILTNDVSHTNTAAVGTLTGPTQGTPAKLSDGYINALASTYLALRSDAGVRMYWKSAGIPFSAVGVATSRPLSATYSGAYSAAPVDGQHGGLNSYPNGYVVYGDASPGSGCRRGMNAVNGDWCGLGSSGSMWVK